MKRSDMAFGVAIATIGYTFLPEKGPEELELFAAIVLLLIGGCIVLAGIWKLATQ